MLTEVEKLRNKARILREAADRIESQPGDYDWYEPAACNCGVVAQIIMKTSFFSLDKLLLKEEEDASRLDLGLMGPWSVRAQLKCPQTGMPFSRVVQELNAQGFNAADICHIEFTDNEKQKSKVWYVVKFFRDWAIQLDRQAQEIL